MLDGFELFFKCGANDKRCDFHSNVTISQIVAKSRSKFYLRDYAGVIPLVTITQTLVHIS